LNELNSINNIAATKTISNALFILLDENKENYFKNYPDPKAYIEAYRRKSDRLNFLKHIMRRRHPALKDINSTDSKQVPLFSTCTSIYTFINAYIEWIQDEKLRNNREYTDKEKIDYVLEQLDDNYKIAVRAIKSDIIDLNLNSTNPKPFPPHLLLNEDLSIYIVDQLPPDQRNIIYEQITSAASTSTAKRLQADDSEGIIHKSTYNDKKKYKPKQQQWAKELKWEILPGEICEACNKNNHNVYKTGCPTLATFCACHAFYNKTPKEKLEPVMASYKQYQRDLQKKMKQRRNTDRAAIKTLTMEYDNEDIDKMKDTFFRKYKMDYNKEQYRQDNPYKDLDSEDDELN
jgi:hypothetical protein